MATEQLDLSEEKGMVPAEATALATVDDGGFVKANQLSAFLEMAIQKEYPPETVQSFLDIIDRLKADWAKEQYFTALSKFQAECPPIPKTKIVRNKDGTERYRYAPIEVVIDTIKAPLANNGFSLTRRPAQEEDGQLSATAVLHHKDGHSESATVTVPLSVDGNMNSIQHIGEAKSYATRYAVLDVTGVVTADGDNDASSLTFAAGAKYADYINAMDAETTLEGLKDTTRGFYDELKPKDPDGAKVIQDYYKTRKEEIENGTGQR